MLSKEQAEAVSSEFLNQERANSEDTNRNSGGFWYMTMGLPGLRSLTPGQRQAILREAHSYFMRRWQTQTAYAIFLLLALAIAFRFPADFWSPGSAGVAGALDIVAFLTARAHYMRRFVRESLSSLK